MAQITLVIASDKACSSDYRNWPFLLPWIQLPQKYSNLYLQMKWLDRQKKGNKKKKEKEKQYQVIVGSSTRFSASVECVYGVWSPLIIG